MRFFLVGVLSNNFRALPMERSRATYRLVLVDIGRCRQLDDDELEKVAFPARSEGQRGGAPGRGEVMQTEATAASVLDEAAVEVDHGAGQDGAELAAVGGRRRVALGLVDRGPVRGVGEKIEFCFQEQQRLFFWIDLERAWSGTFLSSRLVLGRVRSGFP
jgi:hypothetical protein